MSNRFFIGSSIEGGDGRSSYDSCAPAGQLRRYSQAMMSPIMPSRMGMKPAQILNMIEDVEASCKMLGTDEQEAVVNIRAIHDNYATPGTRYGSRWWAPGGALPVQPAMQAPGDPVPPEVHDN